MEDVSINHSRGRTGVNRYIVLFHFVNDQERLHKAIELFHKAKGRGDTEKEVREYLLMFIQEHFRLKTPCGLAYNIHNLKKLVDHMEHLEKRRLGTQWTEWRDKKKC